MLKGRNHQHARIVGEDFLGAVPVMNIEIDDSDPLQAVGGKRMRGADRDAVEQTEAHGRDRGSA